MTEQAAATNAKKGETVTVNMTDGRLVDFGGKRRMLKESFVSSDGTVSVRLDFLNGQTRTFAIPATLKDKFAAHGAEQKLGDEIAGLTDVDDCVMAVDELITRLSAGEWGAKREGNGMAGMSVLARALVEYTGKTIEQIKAFLGTKSHAEKTALRANPKVKAIIDKLEAEKASKGAKVDTDALLGELEGTDSGADSEAATATA
jgi:hypothetical protein